MSQYPISTLQRQGHPFPSSSLCCSVWIKSHSFSHFVSVRFFEFLPLRPGSRSQHFGTPPAFASSESESPPHHPKWCKTSRRLIRIRKLRLWLEVLDNPFAAICPRLSLVRVDDLWRIEDLGERGLVDLLLCISVTALATWAVPWLSKDFRQGDLDLTDDTLLLPLPSMSIEYLSKAYWSEIICSLLRIFLFC